MKYKFHVGTKTNAGSNFETFNSKDTEIFEEALHFYTDAILDGRKAILICFKPIRVVLTNEPWWVKTLGYPMIQERVDNG